MRATKFSPLLLIIPFFVLAWGFFNFYFFDAFYSRAIDPEYAYLINGLNVALLEFNQIYHLDHPGTPFQVYCGLIIRITHLFTGKDAIAQDVFNRPEYYLSAINLSLIILQSLLCFLIAWVGRKREIKTWQLIVLQSGVLFNALMLWLFCRIIPDRWLVIVFLFFIIVYLLYGYRDRRPLKFAIWSGIIMGMGMATKFNFLPVLILPFLLINSNKNRLIYAITGVSSFFFFLLPIIKKIGYYRNFITSIAIHDGFYGEGEKRMFNFGKMKESFFQIFEFAPELGFIIFTSIAAIILAFIYRKRQRVDRQILFFSGILFIILLQMVMVAKHFKGYYLLPLITVYPLVLFIFDDFIQKIGGYRKWTLAPVILLFIIFIGFSAKKTYIELKQEKGNIIQREAMRQYVSDNFASNTLWFVEPTWESAPYIENGLVYGISHCFYLADYLPELIKKNPNIITYEYSEEIVKIWRGYSVPVDSVVVTGTPIYILSTPQRNAGALMGILEKAAQKNNVILNIGTAFSNDNTQIIVVQNQDSERAWDVSLFGF